MSKLEESVSSALPKLLAGDLSQDLKREREKKNSRLTGSWVGRIADKMIINGDVIGLRKSHKNQ